MPEELRHMPNTSGPGSTGPGVESDGRVRSVPATVPEEIHHEDGRIEHPTVFSEPTDASLPGVLAVLIGGAIFLTIVCFIVRGFFHERINTLDQERKSGFPLGSAVPYPVPPEPRLEQLNRLQDDPSSNVYMRQSEKLEILNNYGPTGEKGFVHVPIERAMAALANKLPARDPHLLSKCTAAPMLLGFAAGPSPLAAAAALFPGREQLVNAGIARRQNGLVNSGESSSGRLFKKGKPRWLGQ